MKHLDMPCPKGAWCPSPTHSLNFHNILCMPIPSHCFKMTDFLTALPRDWILFFFLILWRFLVVFFKIYLLYLFFIFGCIGSLFLAVRGLFSGCGEQGPLLVAVRGPIIAVASLAAEHRLRACGPSSCGPRAQQLWLVGSRAQAQ